MSIRWKVPLVLLAISAFLAAASHLVQSWVIMPSFAQLERDQAMDNLDRCNEAIQREIEVLSVFSRDWGAWDELYDYAANPNETFEKQNLNDQTFSNNQLALICLVNPEGKLIWGQARKADRKTVVELPSLFEVLQQPGHRLITHQSVESEIRGIVMTEHGLMLIASRPILTGLNTGPIHGALVMGRWLDEEVAAALASRTRVAMKLWTVSGSVPQEDAAALPHLQAASGSFLREGSSETLHAYGLLRDLEQRPVALLRADLPRSITHQGTAAVKFATAYDIGAALVVMLVMWQSLQWMVIRPLLRVTGHMVHVGKKNDLTARLNLARRDEIGILGAECDRMVASLAEARAKMLDTAHRAGMAEIATEVLHNVGNAMNTINVSTQIVGERLEQSKVGGLEKAIALLREHQSDLSAFLNTDPRGPKLIEYLLKISGTLTGERGGLLKEVHGLQQKIDHIREIIAVQQTYAGGPTFSQEEDVATVVEDAIRMNADALEAGGIEVERQFASIKRVPMNRVKLMQVLGNLIKNAIESMRATPGETPRLTVRVRAEGDQAICVEVSDTGMGIPSDVMKRLFNYGFTTKSDGHGFGLHYCANAMAEMGGSIHACSNVAGHGATFVLRLPTRSVRAAA